MMRRVVQRRDHRGRELHQIAHLQHPVGFEDVFAFIEAEFSGEHSAPGRVHPLDDFESHDGRETAVAQLGFNQREQIIGFFLVALGVGVAGDAEKFA